MSKLPALACALVVAGCQTETPTPPTPTNPTTPGLNAAAPGDTPVQATPGDASAGDVGALPTLPAGVVIPAGFNGIGILAEATEPAVKKMPEWTRVAAQVSLREGKRLLEATGRAERIKNVALARAAAENRARFELAKWLGNEKLEGSRVAETVVDPITHTAFARVEIEVPEGWLPGQPLAPKALAPAPAAPAPQPQ